MRILLPISALFAFARFFAILLATPGCDRLLRVDAHDAFGAATRSKMNRFLEGCVCPESAHAARDVSLYERDAKHLGFELEVDGNLRNFEANRWQIGRTIESNVGASIEVAADVEKRTQEGAFDLHFVASSSPPIAVPTIFAPNWQTFSMTELRASISLTIPCAVSEVIS